jgi:hypothetical protein
MCTIVCSLLTQVEEEPVFEDDEGAGGEDDEEAGGEGGEDSEEVQAEDDEGDDHVRMITQNTIVKESEWFVHYGFHHYN